MITTDSNISPSPEIQAWAASQMKQSIRSVVRVDSNEANQVFRLDFDSESAFLKIGTELRQEYERLQWLYQRVPCPRPVGLTSTASGEVLLSTAVQGNNLVFLRHSLSPQTIIRRLAATLRIIHATSIADFPFGGVGTVLIHGDACLPNFIYNGDTLTGCIDVGDMCIGVPETDLADAVWSIQHNLGSGYGGAFLQAYGWSDTSEETVEWLRLRHGSVDAPLSTRL